MTRIKPKKEKVNDLVKSTPFIIYMNTNLIKRLYFFLCVDVLEELLRKRCQVPFIGHIRIKVPYSRKGSHFCS